MPWPNRVTPFGEIVAVPERGTLMGNRGCLINQRRELILSYKLKRWISCVLEFKGRRREVMTPGLYTELFFLDEATALAAGHRPCAECRRVDAHRFLELWNLANGEAVKRLPMLDESLHRERLGGPHPLILADGVMVAVGTQAYVYLDGAYYPWSPGGYGAPAHVSGEIRQLTPPSIARTLSVGYRPSLQKLIQIQSPVTPN